MIAALRTEPTLSQPEPTLPMNSVADTTAKRSWTTLRDEKARRMAIISPWLADGVLPRERIVDALETLIRPGDRVALEGDNQK